MPICKIEDMTIDTFPVTNENRSDYNICKEMFLKPANFRLVYFSLPSDEGFHLKHAILNFWTDREFCRSVTVCDFTQDLIAAIHSGKYPYDMSKYWDPEVLVIDDLQYVAGKDTTQEEFYNILKRRLEQKKLTVVFSEYPLSRMRGAMRDELIHLLRTGLHTDSDI